MKIMIMYTAKGRGFGHGVGLCQEGAIEMVKNNYKYSEVMDIIILELQ